MDRVHSVILVLPFTCLDQFLIIFHSSLPYLDIFKLLSPPGYIWIMRWRRSSAHATREEMVSSVLWSNQSPAHTNKVKRKQKWGGVVLQGDRDQCWCEHATSETGEMASCQTCDINPTCRDGKESGEIKHLIKILCRDKAVSSSGTLGTGAEGKRQHYPSFCVRGQKSLIQGEKKTCSHFMDYQSKMEEIGQNRQNRF